MKVKANARINDIKTGKPVMEPDEMAEVAPGEKRPMRELTLRLVAVEALVHTWPLLPGERGDPAEKKMKKGDLAEKFWAAKDAEELELTPEEATLTKEAINQLYGPMVVVQAFRLLNG